MKSGYPPGDDLTLADIHAQELAEKGARIAQLEAELAECTIQYEYSAGVLVAAMVRLLRPEAAVLAPYVTHPLVVDATAAALRLAEKDAALAAAHEAAKTTTRLLRGMAESVLGLSTGSVPHKLTGLSADLRHLGNLLEQRSSIPVLVRSAEELRLLRELAVADEAVEEADDYYFGACGAMGEQSGSETAREAARALDDARDRREAKLADLRRFREEPKGLVSRREIRASLPDAYWKAATWVGVGIAKNEAAYHPEMLAALREVVDFLERKAQQLDAGRSGR